MDAFTVEQINWAGRLEETEFLSRLYNLGSLPSFDNRFKDAAGDIWQHRFNNHDWDDNWVFSDSRFSLMNGDDDSFLAFLCETLHPVVRPDPSEAERICQLYNQYLRNDGFQIVEKTRLSGKPVFIGRFVGIGVTPGVEAARTTLGGTDPGYLFQQITRMEAAVGNDPALAIGTAKELIETCCKTILGERQIIFSKSAEIPELVKLTVKALQLAPSDIPDAAKAADTIKRLLSNLGTIAQGLAELRNQYGTGHGKAAKSKGSSAQVGKDDRY